MSSEPQAPPPRKRRRPLTGGSSSPSRKSLPIMDLKSAIDSAKEKFESDIATIRVDDIGDNESPNRISSRKAASAPASPGKALSVMLPTYESKRPRLLKEASSKSYSKGSHLKASLLIPANEVVDNTDNNDDTKKQSKKNTIAGCIFDESSVCFVKIKEKVTIIPKHRRAVENVYRMTVLVTSMSLSRRVIGLFPSFGRLSR